MPANLAPHIIISGADSPYAELLCDLVDSIRSASTEGARVPIGILDVGLTDMQRADLAARNAKVVKPNWDFEFPDQQRVPAHFKAMTARPFLTKYFPGHEVVMWMDADTWVQRWSAVTDYIEGARTGGLAVAQELDRAYANLYNINNSRELFFKSIDIGFGREIALRLVAFPMVNSGVFAMHADSHYWESWRAALGKSLQRHANHMTEQSALNVAVYEKLPLPLFMPATHNWLCIHRLPSFDPLTELFVEPLRPHREIGIMHLTTSTATRDAARFEIKDVNGLQKSMSLRFPRSLAHASLRDSV
jgi:hypothetical protein